MNELKDIIWALLTQERGMRLPRLIKEVYLVDWKCAFNYPPRPCNFKWVYGPCGPTSEKIIGCVQQNADLFRIEETTNKMGLLVKTIYRQDVEHVPVLSQDVMKAIELVNNVATPKTWEALSLLVSSTYPIMQSSMLSDIDIERFAKEYQEMLKYRLAASAEQKPS